MFNTNQMNQLKEAFSLERLNQLKEENTWKRIPRRSEDAELYELSVEERFDSEEVELS